MVIEFMCNGKVWTTEDVDRWNFWSLPEDERNKIIEKVEQYLNTCLLYVLQFQDYTDSFDTDNIFDEKLFWKLAEMIDWLMSDAYDVETEYYDLEKSYERTRYIFKLSDGRFVALKGTWSPYNGFECDGVWYAQQVYPHEEVRTVTVWKDED